jgi:hypothetical protein
MGVSRREFLSLVTASGITLGLSRVGAAQVPDFVTRETLPGRGGWNPAVGGAGRVDGVVKVTGAKLYPSDFRAADLPGWPGETCTRCWSASRTRLMSTTAWISAF